MSYGAESWTLHGMSKNNWKHLRCGYEKDGACKTDLQDKKCNCGWKSGRRKNNAGTNKEEEKKLAGPLAKKELLAEGWSTRKGKREEGSRKSSRLVNLRIPLKLVSFDW